MRMVVVGPGRAGGALALAAYAAGHELVAIVGRDNGRAEALAGSVGADARTLDEPLPDADLVLIAVRDDAIRAVAAKLDVSDQTIGAAVHVSGLVSVSALDPLEARGVPTGGFHPLQTMPQPHAGAERLTGAWIGVTADEPLRSRLFELAASLGAQPFELRDDARAVYHAGAAAAANFPIVALAMARDLFVAAGVPFEAARPLVNAVVANVFTMGPEGALTGPIARNDVATVEAQLEAVVAVAPRWREEFAAFIAMTAGIVDDPARPAAS